MILQGDNAINGAFSKGSRLSTLPSKSFSQYERMSQCFIGAHLSGDLLHRSVDRWLGVELSQSFTQDYCWECR
jgi:hypothetical protein